MFIRYASACSSGHFGVLFPATRRDVKRGASRARACARTGASQDSTTYEASTRKVAKRVSASDIRWPAPPPATMLWQTSPLTSWKVKPTEAKCLPSGPPALALAYHQHSHLVQRKGKSAFFLPSHRGVSRRSHNQNKHLINRPKNEIHVSMREILLPNTCRYLSVIHVVFPSRLLSVSLLLPSFITRSLLSPKTKTHPHDGGCLIVLSPFCLQIRTAGWESSLAGRVTPCCGRKVKSTCCLFLRMTLAFTKLLVSLGGGIRGHL